MGSDVRVPPSAKFFRLSQLRKLRGCEQVAAVCYRERAHVIEFLLVQTRGGRWTFPKGGVEPGLTHAQAAAIEAFEEAGVHGRMEEEPFTRYVRRKNNRSEKALAINAHLCEVLRLSPPQESKRNRTWFNVEKTKRCLQEDRTADHGAELSRVVDRAVARIESSRRRLPCIAIPAAGVLEKDAPRKDALQKVQFEAFTSPEIHSRMVAASFTRYVRHQRDDMRNSEEIELAVNARLSQVLRPEVLRADLLRLGPGQGFRGVTRTAADALQKPPFAVDDARGTTPRQTLPIGRKTVKKLSHPDSARPGLRTEN